MLIMMRVLRRTAVRQLLILRPSVQIDDAAYDDHVYRMVHIGLRRELILLAISVLVVGAWFLALGNPMPTAYKVHLPPDPLPAAFFLACWVIFGWLGLNIVSSTIEFGRGLGDLSHKPLAMNVFDPTNLLPFGQMAVVHSLTAAGIILILLIGLGSPTELIDWLVIILASAASMLALIIPLLGVHNQMKENKTQMLLRMHEELVRLNTSLLSKKEYEPTEMSALNNRVSALVSLRKTAIEAPNWPFQNTVTTSRAVLVATSPLIYFIITEIIRAYLSPVLK
jgi:hypothetical protein